MKEKIILQGRMQGVEVNNKSCEEFIQPERIWLEPGGGKMGAESGPHSTESQGERLHSI